MRLIIPVIAGVTVLLLIPSSNAVADGCYVAEVAHAKPPAIPKQRALVVHRQDVERLIVESSLDAEGQSFGWIIPVPKPPTDLARSIPGILDTLGNVTEPEITHDRRQDLVAVIVLAWFAVVLSLSIIGRLRVGIILLLTLLLMLFLLPSMATSRGLSSGDYNGVVIRDYSQIGNYDVAVLDADTVDALNTWLNNNGYALLPEQGLSIVEAYIRDKWSFVVARLRREENGGLTTPHPLAMSFPTDSAIYPMRLTSLSASPIALELYVLADYRADVDGLRLDYCSTLTGPEWRVLSYTHNHRTAVYRSVDIPGDVGLPSLVDLLWDGCVLTRLSTEVHPSDITQDYSISPQNPVAFRHHWYSNKGAWMTGSVGALLAWSGTLMITACVLRARRGAGVRWVVAVKHILLPATAVGIVVVVVVYARLHKVPVVVDQQTKSIRFFGAHIIAHYLAGYTRELSDLSGMTIDELRRQCRSYLRGELGLANPYTGRLIVEQEAPGDYEIIERDGRPMVRVYSAVGVPWENVLGPVVQEGEGLPGYIDATVPSSSPEGGAVSTTSQPMEN